MPSRRYIDLPTDLPQDSEGWTRAYADIQTAFVRSVRHVEKETKASGVSSRDGVYVGNCGIAMMEYYVAGLNFSSPSLSAKLSPESREILNSSKLRIQADHHMHTSLRHLPFPSTIQTAHRVSFLETDLGRAFMVLQRCVESLKRARYEEDENVLANLRRGWRSAVGLVITVLQRVPAEDREESRPRVPRKDDQSESGLGALDELEVWDDDGCEVLYGRAGFLYGLLAVRKTLDGVKNLRSYKKEMEDSQKAEVEAIVSDEYLGVVVESIVRRGRYGARVYREEVRAKTRRAEERGSTPPLMWRWHGKRYLGAAHGVVGILQMLLSCPKQVVERYTPEILATVEWVVAVQDIDGNWPSKAPMGSEDSDNELVQWCHGAQGVVILLSTVLRLDAKEDSHITLPPGHRPRFLESLRRGANLVYEQGLLVKGVGLCHGVAGAVYALLAAANVLDSSTSTRYFKRAIHLAHLATFVDQFVEEGEMRVPDRPWSLYEGMAGMCCAWAAVLVRLGRTESRGPSGMPAYEDIAVY